MPSRTTKAARMIAAAIRVLAVAISLVAPLPAQEPNRAKQSPSLDQQLLDDLNRPQFDPRPVPADPPGSVQSEHSLARILGQMRAAESRLWRQDTSAATQQVQRQIVEELAKLLAQREQPPAGSRTQHAPPLNAAKSRADGNHPASGTPEGGADRTERSAGQPAQKADVHDIVGRIWGHLPDKLRDQMQGTLSEQFLPKYERVIEEYYQRLADEPSSRP